MRIVTDYKHAQQIIIELDARIAKLEAACTVQTEMAPERTVPEIWKALANSEGENEPHPDHCLCDDCVTLENMEERLEISRKFMEQATEQVENNE